MVSTVNDLSVFMYLWPDPGWERRVVTKYRVVVESMCGSLLKYKVLRSTTLVLSKTE